MNGRDRPPEWPVDSDRAVEPERAPQRDETVVRADRPRANRGLNWTTLALIGGLIIVVLVIAYLASSRNPDQDKLTGTDTGAQTAGASDPEKLCADKSTYDLIKRELFHRAAQLRGSDQTAFDQLSGYAVLRMENPVMESQDDSRHAVNCSGSLSLDLPPGVSVVGGRRTLSSDVDYTVQPAADGSGNVVLLRNADAIIAPLATLARSGQATQTAPAPASGTAVPPTGGQAAPEQPQAPQSAPPPQPQQPQPQPTPAPETSSAGRPSFDCAKARTKGEIAVCSNAGLAALDRNMASQYVRALRDADPEQQALLRRTRDRFLGYRDRCPNRSCIGDAYVGRMREIRDIMEGNWQPHR